MPKNPMDVLAARYPQADISPFHETADILMEDHGFGPVIVIWNEDKLGEMPTPEQIEAWCQE